MTHHANNEWGKQPHSLISLTEGWQHIAAAVKPFKGVTVRLEHAAGRVLTQPVAITTDYPAFNKAMMDGFAVRSSDCTLSDSELTVIGLAPAGSPTIQTVSRRQAIRINTGAPLPDGADAVIRIEDTTLSDGDRLLTLKTPVACDQNVSRKASIRRKGDIVLAPPIRLDPVSLSAAASAGVSELSVAPEIAVAIAVTGDEIVPAGSRLKQGQIYESNGPMLAALVRQFNAIPREFGIARDKISDLKKTFAEAMRDPIVITVGGMSMGTRDLVPQAFEELGVRWIFHGVRVRPGKPVAYGLGPDGQHIFGLPGNPVSAFVCAWLFVRMAVRGLQGFNPSPPHRWRAIITKDLPPHRDTRPAFVPARVWNSDEQGMMTEPCGWSGSSDPFGLAMANALLVRDPADIAIAAGDAVDVILITDDL